MVQCFVSAGSLLDCETLSSIPQRPRPPRTDRLPQLVSEATGGKHREPKMPEENFARGRSCRYIDGVVV